MLRPKERLLLRQATSRLQLMVVDEFHYCGRSEADIAMLLCCLCERSGRRITFIGTSANLATSEDYRQERKRAIANVASRSFRLLLGMGTSAILCSFLSAVQDHTKAAGGRGDAVSSPEGRAVRQHRLTAWTEDAFRIKMAFCRECGQESHIALCDNVQQRLIRLLASATYPSSSSSSASFALANEKLWNGSYEDLPNKRVESSPYGLRIKSNYREYKSQLLWVGPDGKVMDEASHLETSTKCWHTPRRLVPRLRCRTTSDPQEGDFGQLTTIREALLVVIEDQNELGLHLPDYAQYRPSEEVYNQADFYYKHDLRGICVFIDGPHHDKPEQARRDRESRSRLQDLGYRVLTISYNKLLGGQVKDYPDVFGHPT